MKFLKKTKLAITSLMNNPQNAVVLLSLGGQGKPTNE
jgi:hypothetical protein